MFRPSQGSLRGVDASILSRTFLESLLGIDNLLLIVLVLVVIVVVFLIVSFFLLFLIISLLLSILALGFGGLFGVLRLRFDALLFLLDPNLVSIVTSSDARSTLSKGSRVCYLRILSRGLGLDDAPWRHGLDNVREGVPDTHCGLND